MSTDDREHCLLIITVAVCDAGAFALAGSDRADNGAALDEDLDEPNHAGTG